ncbi:hypothetical protein HJC23_007070 [Cyclotella cryptica]|uniref:Uncharacterized protein n=1 Tax=Cyclotella cryptica TaxID=29204 RepID=A0ABD3P8N6_9STRA
MLAPPEHRPIQQCESFFLVQPQYSIIRIPPPPKIVMRMQSPASTGLLPASYSRRRRNRPNESTTESTTNGYREVSDVEIPHSHHHHSTTGVVRSPSHKKQMYTATTVVAEKDDGSDSSENDENDDRRINHRRSRLHHRPCPYEEGYEDVLPKPPPLSDFLVNDRNYSSYLIGGRGRGGASAYRGLRGKGVLESKERSWYGEPVFLAKFCAGWSLVGMVFLIYAALMMELQPLYIKGVSPKPNISEDGTYRFRKETSNALKAAAAYFLTMVLSLIYLQVKDLNLGVHPHIGRICHLRRMISSAYFRYRRRHYDSIPDNHHDASYKSFGGRPGSILPLHSHRDDQMLKSRRRTKRNNALHSVGEDESSAVGGVWGVLKGFGFGGSSATGRKKNR